MIAFNAAISSAVTYSRRGATSRGELAARLAAPGGGDEVRARAFQRTCVVVLPVYGPSTRCARGRPDAESCFPGLTASAFGPRILRS